MLAVMAENATGDPSRGVALRMSGCTPQGVPLSCFWKAFASDSTRAMVVAGSPSHSAAPPLKWEFKWFLSDCGYEDKGKMRAWRHLHDNWNRWKTALTTFGFDVSSCMGRSRHAVSKTPGAEQDLQNCEQDHWILTGALIALLAWWAQYRRQLDVKERVSLLGRLFCERALPAASALEHCFLCPPAASLVKCKKEPVIEGRCACMQHFSQSAAPLVGCSPQHTFFLKLRHLTKGLFCEAIRDWVMSTIAAAAAAIDEDTASWADWDWQTTSAAQIMSGNKKRRIDYHLKKYVLQVVVEDGKCKTSARGVRLAGCDPAQGVRWVHEEASAYRASTWLTFSKSLQISLAVDASRIGKPAKDYLVAAISDVQRNLHGVLPPQVSRDLCFTRGRRPEAGRSKHDFSGV